jgi:hypothetical protein
MSRVRKKISFKTKLVAALCQMRHEVDGKWELILNHEEAKALSEDEILSIFHWDHTPIPHAEGGEDVHYNLAPVLIPGHRKKTATIDVPGIAKRKRVATGYIEHTRTMNTPRDQREPKKSRWQSRPFPKRGKPNERSGR